jgi:hypothetical protein
LALEETVPDPAAVEAFEDPEAVAEVEVSAEDEVI